ncbi:MAG: von Willebrand factor type A domain-containing protein, partial [Verrucomicrobiae bacterium]|nr:von Willebrand factor type A domain-containing protein [Verrucomicrobiae bacterium]NNJ86878.1 hypothetical protein [Akkermansiaceae bacterium]
PPLRAVRIEEMINHFRYQKPGMVKGSGVVADMELCDTPWNPLTMLLAVHVSVDPDAGDAAGITGPVYLEINPERVGRVRLLGYAQLKHSGQKKSSGPAKLSRSQGNYVIYELENQDAAERSAVVATLHLGQEGSQAQLPISQKHSWIHASPDLRFASVVSACGILLHQHQGVGELDAGRLLSFVELLEKQDSTRLGGDRREALQLCRKAAGLIGAVSGN